MFKVTFQGPIIVGSAEALAELLSSARAVATVEPMMGCCGEADSAPNVPATSAEPEPAAAPAARRSRKPRNQEEAAPAQTGTAGEVGQSDSANAAAAGVDPEAGKGDSKQGDAPPPVDTDLLERFTGLVDRDYDSALKLLENFGIPRFSDLKEDQLGAFADALTQLQA